MWRVFLGCAVLVRGCLGLLGSSSTGNRGCRWPRYSAAKRNGGYFNQTFDNDKVSGGVPPSDKGLYIDPDHKFALCYIAKTGSSSWIQILQRLYKNDPTCCKGDWNFAVGGQSQRQFGDEGRAKVFNDNDAVRAVFLRDPIARFASAFLDKCIFNAASYNIARNCVVPAGRQIKDIPTMRAAVKWAVDNLDTIEKWNGHWTPQSYYCGLDKYFDSYTVLGFMTKDKMASDAMCLIRRAGIEEFNTGFGPKFDQPVFKDGVDTYTDAGMHGSTSDDSETTVLKNLFTREAAETLYEQVLKRDYDLLNMEKPSWIEEATGKWFDVIPKEQNEYLERKAVDVETDVDDIVDVARAVGYFNVA